MNECSACGQRFRSDRAFARHRIGRGDARRCRTPEEIWLAGWRNGPRGWTDRPNTPGLPLEPLANVSSQSAAARGRAS